MQITPINANNSKNYKCTTKNKVPSFGVKIPTIDVIQVTTGFYTNPDIDRVAFSVCDKMTHSVTYFADLEEVLKLCRNALLEQFPVLREIKQSAACFFNGNHGFRIEKTHSDAWNSIQVEKFGQEELDVKPLEDYSEKITTPTTIEALKRLRTETGMVILQNQRIN